MTTALYDAIADEYASTLLANTDPDGIWNVAIRSLLDLLGPVIDQDVCDLACGEGTVARQMAESGARSVVGVDLSEGLLAHARERSFGLPIRYYKDDAQVLAKLPDGAFDAVACSLALMDIPDLAAVFTAVHRILRPSGRFVVSLTHPCFQMPNTAVENAEDSENIRYQDEGHWRSDYASGIRGRVGAHHRTISTYINTLLAAGFTLNELREPTEALRTRDGKTVPSLFLIHATRNLG